MMITGVSLGLQAVVKWMRELFASGLPGRLLAACTFTLLLGALSDLRGQSASANGDPHRVIVDARAPSHAFPHFWERTFGSGRAILSLRESYREDLRAVKRATDFDYIRFHAILDDEVGLYNAGQGANPSYNFSYVDEIYDALFVNRVKNLGNLLAAFDLEAVDGAVNGTGWLTRFISTISMAWDKYVIDGLVNVLAFVTKMLSWPARILQTGVVQNYAWIITMGVLIFVLYSVLR